MRHLGEKKINERLPLVRELASSYVGHDPGHGSGSGAPGDPFHDGRHRQQHQRRNPDAGLFAIGETACSGLHGANRLGSNSLTDLLVSGKRSAERAADYAREAGKVKMTRPSRARPKLVVPGCANCCSKAVR